MPTMISSEVQLKFRPVRYVIFDLDGLLIDTESLNYKIINELLGKYGKSFDNQFRLQLIGQPLKVALGKIIAEYKLNVEFDEFQKEYSKIKDTYYEHIELMPGAEPLVNHLYDNNVPIAIATSSTREDFEQKTKKFKKLMKKFHHATTVTDAGRGKPYPDIFLTCAYKFPQMPESKHVLVLEDSLNGVEAARSANMQVVMVPDKDLPEEYRRRATHVIPSLCHFDPEVFDLPGWHT